MPACRAAVVHQELLRATTSPCIAYASARLVVATVFAGSSASARAQKSLGGRILAILERQVTEIVQRESGPGSI